MLAGLAVAAAAWAAGSLLSAGAPVPFLRGAPVKGESTGVPLPGTVKLLISDVADPAGGSPWALRYWETDRRYGCIQVGRLDQGRLGQIAGGKVFHELLPGVTGMALGGCFLLDGSGHAFAAASVDAAIGAQPASCPPGLPASTVLRGAGGSKIRCGTPARTIDFGLLGPNARRFTYRSRGHEHRAAPAGNVGAYLVVQKHLAPVTQEVGFHHKDPALNVRGPAGQSLALTPDSQVITSVDYAAGTCRVQLTGDARGACAQQAGYVAIPQPAVGDVRAPVRISLTPHRSGIRVRFSARQPVIDGRGAYTIEVRPYGRGGFITHEYEHDLAAGTQVHITVGLYNHRRGPYRIVVRYRIVGSHPGPIGGLQWPGVLVGQARIVVPH